MQTNGANGHQHEVSEKGPAFPRERLDSTGASTTGRSEPFQWQGTDYSCHAGGHWRVSHEGLEEIAGLNRLVATPSGGLRWKKYEEGWAMNGDRERE